MTEIAAREHVHINVPNENWETIVREQLKEHGGPTRNVFFHYIKTNESWCRDHGPAFLIKRKKNRDGSYLFPTTIVDWGFNAWGGKYPPYDDDDAVPTRIAEELKVPVFYPRSMGVSPMSSVKRHGRDGHATVVMEGGSVDFNGAGTILTTSDCLLNKNRNPQLNKSQIEQYLKDCYGQNHICWLTGGIEGDDTDGHIDDLARFIGPTKIVIA